MVQTEELSGRTATRQHHGRGDRTRLWWGLAFILPALALYGVFIIYPLITTVMWSLYRWDGIQAIGLAGLDNFRATFTTYPFNEQLLPAAFNNLKFFIVSAILQLGFGLMLAVLLRRRRRTRVWLQAAYTLPFMLSPLIIGYVWALLLNPIFGPVRGAMDAVGLGSLYAPWLGQESTALVAMGVINSWQSIGLPMLLFYAALSAIPNEIYEAARCDGCSTWQSFRLISLPLIMPTVLTLTLLTFIWSFNVFDLAYAIGGPNGSPGGATDVLGLLFYRVAFTGSSNALGSASAMATMLFALLLACSALVMHLRQRFEQRT